MSTTSLINEKFSLLTRQVIGPFTKALLVETDNEIYAVDPEDYGIGWQLRNNGAFAYEQVEAIRHHLNKDSRVLIVGAHIGTVAIPLSRYCSEVVAIEPNRQSFQLLEFNIHINQVTNCIAYNIAAGDKAEYIRFLVNRTNSAASKRKTASNDNLSNYEDLKEIIIPAFPLDDFLKDRSFDVVMLFTAGSDHLVLKGMQRILSSAKLFSPEEKALSQLHKEV